MNDQMNIVQVFLGSALPGYVYDQLSQTRLLNPQTPIFFILNRASAFDDVLMARLRVTVVWFESLVKSKNHRSFLRWSLLRRRGPGGFWQFTTERFFAIESLLNTFRLNDVIHLENDVMLYSNLDGLLPIFRKHYEHVGLVMDADWRCIPGFLYLRDAKSVASMNEFIVRKSAWRRENDMRALGRFMREVGPPAVDALPVIPDEYVRHYDLENTRGERTTRAYYSNNFADFGGIFDAAAIGQFLGGIDPQHGSESTVGFINETAVYDPRRLNVSWKEEHGLRLPCGNIGGTSFRIFNLHIHSKRLAAFSSSLGSSR